MKYNPAEYQHQAFLPKNIEGKQSQAQILTLKNKMKKYDFWAALVSVAGLIIAFVEVLCLFLSG